MPLVAVKVKSGLKFRLYLLEQDGHCEMTEFLESLDDVETDRIDRYMKRTVEIGLILNPEQSKSLGNGRHYWRTRGGVRVFYFTDAGRVIVCTNGYIKKKRKLDPNEIEQLDKWRMKYLEAKQNNT